MKNEQYVMQKDLVQAMLNLVIDEPYQFLVADEYSRLDDNEKDRLVNNLDDTITMFPYYFPASFEYARGMMKLSTRALFTGTGYNFAEVFSDSVLITLGILEVPEILKLPKLILYEAEVGQKVLEKLLSPINYTFINYN